MLDVLRAAARERPAWRSKGSTLPFAVCGYTPDQFRGAYGIDNAGGKESDHGNSNAGRGQTVAITDAFDSSTLLQDANTYSTLHGDRAFRGGQFTDKSVPEDASKEADCGGSGWYGEQALDIEAVHGMAQGANVLYYGAASCYDDDLLAALAQIVHDNKASIVTNSWGEPTFVMIDGTLYATIDQNLVNAYESVFKHGAVQGIGFYFSSGDNGDELDAWGYAHPDWPTGDPWVTAVGGTSIAIGKSNNRLNHDSSLTTGPGWDDVTGVGESDRPVLRRVPRRAPARGAQAGRRAPRPSVRDCAAAGLGRAALLVRAVRGAHERAGEDRAEAERLALLAEPAGTRPGAPSGRSACASADGLQVLADRDDVDAVGAEVTERLDELVVRLAEACDQAGLRQHG